MVPKWVVPSEWAAVTNPGREAAVHMNGGTVDCLVGPWDCSVDRERVHGRQIVLECELKRSTLLSQDKAAQMFW